MFSPPIGVTHLGDDHSHSEDQNEDHREDQGDVVLREIVTKPLAMLLLLTGKNR